MKAQIRKILNNVILWIVVILTTLLPLSLSKFGINLILIPQIEVPFIFLLAIYANVSSLQVFLYGLLIDVSYGSPIGVSSMILLLSHRILTRFKYVILNQDNIHITSYFVYTAITITVLKYFIIGIANGITSLPEISILLLNFVITVISYPILQFLCLYFTRSKS
ncbi:MAG: hypothetical protein RLZZ59_114 [Pseudomonadota bacterium]